MEAFFAALRDYGDVIGGALAGVIALYAVTTSVRTAKRQIISQFELARGEREANEAEANKSVTEWYFARTVDLRTHLFAIVISLRKSHDALEAGTLSTYGGLKRQIALQQHALGDGLSNGAPELIGDAVLTDFSRIENPAVRGQITILSALVNRLIDQERFTLYEMELGLSEHADDKPLDDAARDALRHVLTSRAETADLLLRESHKLLALLGWNNNTISRWHRGIETECYASLARINADIRAPERLDEAQSQDKEPA